MPMPPTLRGVALLSLAVACAPLAAQTDTAPAPAPAPSPTPSPAPSTAPSPAPTPAPAPAPSPAPAPTTPPAAAPAGSQRIEITGGRESDTEARRRATAAKIVIGREEIEKFGDATLGEVLRRLPGVTTPGAPGRGGPPRLRGLGSGFTQLLIDGQRLPPGFSLESLSPEQIERIEILRAPTAETGARAIAGTINIITREGFRRRLNDLRVGMGTENGQPQGGVFWTHNDSAGNLTYTLNAGLFANRRETEGFGRVELTDLNTGTLLEQRRTDSLTRSKTLGLNLGGRLQWRLGEGGDSLTLMPGVFSNRNESTGHSDTVFALRRPSPPAPELSDSADSHSQSRFVAPRLMLQYRQRVAGWRLEGGGTVSGSRSHSDSAREERRADASLLRTQDDEVTQRERRLQLNLKGSRLLGPENSEHSLVAGAEIEGARRNDTRRTLEDGVPALQAFGENFEASTLRGAAYVQDEWAVNPNWALHAGLRWEGIATTGQALDGTRPENRNSVWTPLVHLLWKPDPKKRDQVRLSLTRSWRAPETAQLIARPNVNRLYAADQVNVETAPDSAGNPDLKPELATGVDLAFERFLEGGGLLSANVFHRRIRDLMRSRVEQEFGVPWSSAPYRWVRRTRNVGQATTEGLELEAKFRLDQLVSGSWPVELRANLALFRSRVDGVPGPDNRLDDQARATANLGADYRVRGTPVTLGGNLNWVPGTTTRRAADETSTTSTKRQWDLYALWSFNPNLGLRVLANNIDPRDFTTETFNDAQDVSGPVRSHAVSGGPSYTNVSVRLEMKL